MSASKKRHVLAELRDKLGLKQHSLAGEAGYHWRTIQDVERLKLKLSRRLAEDISQVTRVSPDWLLANDPDRPCVNVDGSPYRDSEDYEQARSERSVWPTYSKLERAYALSACFLLFEQYNTHRSILDRLPNNETTWTAFRQCIDNAVEEFLEDYPPRPDPPGAAVRRSLRDIQDDLRELDKADQETAVEYNDEQMFTMLLLWPRCNTKTERALAVTFLREALIHKPSLKDLLDGFEECLASHRHSSPPKAADPARK